MYKVSIYRNKENRLVFITDERPGRVYFAEKNTEKDETDCREYLAPSDRLDLFPIWEYTLIKDIMYEGVISEFIDEYMKKEQVE